MLTRLIDYADEAAPEDAPRPAPDSPRLLHVAVHRGWAGRDGRELNLNAGDTCLNPLVRQFVDRALGRPARWDLQQIWEPLDAAEMRARQKDYDAMVIGGGGLFLPEQPGTNVGASGWTWNCPPEAIDEIAMPVAIFAVGYNRFRDHEPFSPTFRVHLNKLAAHTRFFGMRNTGSIEAVRGYLDSDEQRDKVKLQVCPTTLIWQLRADMQALAEAQEARQSRILALNVAFDRVDNRFGGDTDSALARIAGAIGHAQRAGWTIRVVAHKTIDRQIEPYLDAADVDYETHDISPASSDGVMRFYAETDLVVGLRGHAQMIPFGLRRPMISVISHDKLRFFLDDIGRPQWGVDVREPDFEAALCAKIDEFDRDRPALLADIAAAQEELWQRTLPRFGELKAALVSG